MPDESLVCVKALEAASTRGNQQTVYIAWNLAVCLPGNVRAMLADAALRALEPS